MHERKKEASGREQIKCIENLFSVGTQQIPPFCCIEFSTQTLILFFFSFLSSSNLRVYVASFFLGSGILSYFAVQAGAKKVYAVEASDMALKMKKLVKAASLPNAKNDFLKDRVEVIQGKSSTIALWIDFLSERIAF